MIFYASGAITDTPTLELVVDKGIALLTSYAYKGAFNKNAPLLCAMLKERGKTMRYMVDSGAFTAWNKGKNVNRAALITFYNQALDMYGEQLDLTFVALDKIPGKQGVARTAQDFIDAANETVANYEHMLKHVRGYVKPVYHDGEAQWVLDAYAGASYISLSANQDMAYAEREAWVAHTAPLLPGKQLHGLAMTGTRMLRTIRWHSVDSAAWRLWSAMGAIAWLREDGSLKILATSKESPRNKDRDLHLMTLPTPIRENLVSKIEEAGITLEAIQTDALARARWNITVFQRACDWAASQPVLELVKQKGLFDA